LADLRTAAGLRLNSDMLTVWLVIKVSIKNQKELFKELYFILKDT